MASKINKEYMLKQLRSDISEIDPNTTGRDDVLKTLQIFSSQLSTQDIGSDPDDQDNIDYVSLQIARVILPRSDVVAYDDPLDEPLPESRHLALTATKLIAFHGLTIISQLKTFIPPKVPIDPEIAISIITYTNPLDPWTDSTTISLANDILSWLLSPNTSSAFIITGIFMNFIRPLFLKTKKLESITSTGRKAMPSSAPPTRFDAAKELDHANQPWRYETVYTVTVLGWAIENISPENIKPNMHLILPPLLHLLDTSSHVLRYRGLLILPIFLKKLTPQLLTQTGLGSVFEDAIAPTLMYLPTLTPLQESELLVSTAWDAIFALHDVWFALPTTTSNSMIIRTQPMSQTKLTDNVTTANVEKTRIKFLLKHLRDSLLHAWSYTYPSHPRILTILLGILAGLIPKLGTHTILHLKDVLPIVSSVLLDPFILSTLDGRCMFKEAINVLRQVVLSSWTRIRSDHGRRMEVLRILVGAWKSVKEWAEEEEEVERRREAIEIQKSLNVVGRALCKTVMYENDEDHVGDFERDLKRLKEVDESIADLFWLPGTKHVEKDTVVKR